MPELPDFDAVEQESSLTREAIMSHLMFPNESAEYRKARNDLLADEMALRRHIEEVAAKRRALPPGAKWSRITSSSGSAITACPRRSRCRSFSVATTR
jgi:hypothetical protein